MTNRKPTMNRGNASWYTASKWNHFEADSTPKNTSAVTNRAPAMLLPTSGWVGSAPNAAAKVHVTMSTMGFQGIDFASPVTDGRPSCFSGSRFMLA